MPRVLPLFALIALAGCQKAPELRVDEARVQLSPVRGNPSVAYFTVHGGPTDTTLISVSSPVAIKSEMHESMNKGGMATMAPVTAVPVPAKGTVSFAPGGKHVMLYNINPGIKPGGRPITLILAFGNGERISVDAPAVAMGATPAN